MERPAMVDEIMLQQALVGLYLLPDQYGGPGQSLDETEARSLAGQLMRNIQTVVDIRIGAAVTMEKDTRARVRLVWRAASTGEAEQWMSPICDCAFHPVPYPHWHICNSHQIAS